MIKRSLLAASIQSALVVSMGAAASLAIADDVEGVAVEEVVVTGIRSSLQDAINTKRNASTVVEAISSEDVGKFPDKNVAESLSRLANVSVDRSFGEGERITIRGAGPDFNRTLLNGQSVATADWFILDNPARSFNYTLLPSTLVSSLEVHKSSMASLDEGSIGGTVNVKTRRPFDLASNEVHVNVSANHGEKSGETDPALSALYSFKTDNERFGFLISGVDQTTTIQREGFEVLGWADTNANGVMTPTVMGAPVFIQERELQTWFTSVQFALTENAIFTLDYLNTELQSDNQNANWLAWTGNVEDQIEATGNVVNGSLVGGQIGSGAKTGVNFINRVSKTQTESLTLNFEYTSDAFDLDVAVGSTEAEGGTYRETSWEYVNGDSGFDYDLGTPGLSTNPAASDAAAFGAGWIWGGEKPTTDEEQYAQVDFSMPLEMGFVTSIEAGVKIREAKRTQDRKVYSWHGPGTLDDASLAPGWPVYLQYIFDNCPTLASCGLDALGTVDVDAPVTGNIIDQLAQNRDVMEDIAFNGLNGVDADYAISRELANTWEVQEDTTAVYVQANFESDNIRGNFGLRYVSTDQTSYGYEFSSDSWGFQTLDRDWLNPSHLAWVSQDNSYSEVLPSFNMAIDMSADTVLRVAAAKVMSRQNWANLSAFQSFGDLSVSNPTGQAGNPNLKPIFANKFDVSYEWYYADASMLSATFFYSDQDSYTVNSTFVAPVYDEQNMADVDVTFSKPENGEGGVASGLELSLQHTFDELGFQANYAYTSTDPDDSSAEDKVPGVSEHTANVMAFYENDLFGARVMYNYRSEYYNGLHWNGNPHSTDAFGQMDASLTWHLTDSIQLDFEAMNLLDEQIKVYSESEERLMSLYENGRRYVVTARFKF